MTGLCLWDAYDVCVGSDIHETYVIELGVAAMEKPEVQEAMKRELQNMVDYQVFGEKVTWIDIYGFGSYELQEHGGRKPYL